jgi:ATP-dependent DNA ligase
MEARPVQDLPEGEQWRYEPKWDGFRCLAFRDGENVELRSKSGQPLGRYFPDVAAAVAGLSARQFVLDGEIIIPVERGLSFEAMQLRLHPAASWSTSWPPSTPPSTSPSTCWSGRTAAV